MLEEPAWVERRYVAWLVTQQRVCGVSFVFKILCFLEFAFSVKLPQNLADVVSAVVNSCSLGLKLVAHVVAHLFVSYKVLLVFIN